ncbi:MAG: heparinase II/III-family protein, partial [Spirochaetales bacterium]|nr:heparinase II/III-family protein [Spirochaetales bacterium]
MGAFLHRVHIDGDWYVNFADGGAKLTPPPELLYRYGKRIGDAKLAKLGLSYLAPDNVLKVTGRWYPAFRQLSYLFSYNEMSKLGAGDFDSTIAKSGYDSSKGGFDVSWLPNTEVFTCRRSDFFLGAKGGFNNESHNHNDIGQFVLFSHGEPFIIDVGVGDYTKKTFSDQRYEIWTMQSAYHNLPRIGGHDQLPGKIKKAKNCRVDHDDESVTFSLEMQDAYPSEAGIELWHRTLTAAGTGILSLKDSYRLTGAQNEIALFLMTPWCPEIDGTIGGGQTLRLTAASGQQMEIEIPTGMKADWEKIEFDDKKLTVVWGRELYRVTLLLADGAPEGTWSIEFVPLPVR